MKATSRPGKPNKKMAAQPVMNLDIRASLRWPGLFFSKKAFLQNNKRPAASVG